MDSDLVNFWCKAVERCGSPPKKSSPFLGELIMKMLIQTHSSAYAERTFSAVSLNKTKLRNKLSFTTLNAFLGAK